MLELVLQSKSPDLEKQKILDYIRNLITNEFLFTNLRKVAISHKDLDDLTISEFKNICDVFEEDIYEAISVETCVNKRNTIGAPGNEAMKQVIALNDKYLATFKNTSD